MLSDTHEEHLSADDQCQPVLDKIDFLVQVSRIAIGVDQIEPLLNDLLDQTLRRSACRPKICQRLSELLQKIDGDNVVVVQFCMHALRWPEIHDEAARLLSEERSINRRRLYERVLESFLDDWPERDLYDRFG